MFKVGDRVRCSNADMDLTEGKIYTVEGIFDGLDKWAEKGDPYVIDDVGDKRNALCGCFEPATEGPVRTVTRREIVPGVYGDVTIEVDEKGAFVYIRDSISTAEELREAAHMFNQLAEALEDA